MSKIIVVLRCRPSLSYELKHIVVGREPWLKTSVRREHKGVFNFNGDHRDDVLWRNGDGALTTWLGQANGGLASNADHFWAGVSADWMVQHADLMWV